MILEIKKYPDPVLKKKTAEITEISEDIKKNIADMKETLIESRGLGLAAPQVGLSKKIVIVHLVNSRSAASDSKVEFQAIINPRIIKKSREIEIEEEGCLSFPDLFIKIKRSESVEVEALNSEGEKIVLKADGLPARVLQHEIDHLNGILFIDRIPFWQKIKIKNKLK